MFGPGLLWIALSSITLTSSGWAEGSPELPSCFLVSMETLSWSRLVCRIVHVGILTANPGCGSWSRTCWGFLTAHPGAKAPQWVIIPFSCTNPQRAVSAEAVGVLLEVGWCFWEGWTPLTSVHPQPRGCWQHVLRCAAWGHHPDSHRWTVWQHAWLHDPAGAEKAEGEHCVLKLSHLWCCLNL